MVSFCSTSRIATPRRAISSSRLPTCSTSIGARPSVGSSIRIRSGSPISVRHMVSICCSPPDSTPAGLFCRSARLGNSRNTSSKFHRPNCPAALEAQHQVLPHRQRRKHLAVLRHVADAGPGHEIGTQAGDVAAAIAHRAHRIDQAHDRLARRRAPDPVAAEQRDDLAFTHREIDALQDVALAVERVQVADLEHQAATFPRYASCTARSARIAAGGPEAITLP